MKTPRYRRRKEDRPKEIVAAAFAEFAEHGYAATKVEDVAARAGVSKGLTYLYFKTKEDLFRAVIRNVVGERLDALIDVVEQEQLSGEAFLRGPMLDFMKRVPDSPIPVVIQLLLAEGGRHPDLVKYYFDNIVAKGLQAIRRFVARGVARGEFRVTAVNELPQLFLAPVVLAMIWRLLFPERTLDTDKLMEAQLEMILAWIKV
ncbi:MAG TPA: TetR/AcrR family transcriptional regulator [Woeseiaceae bacterium]|nr:TetR/AcrR family transcriptional regulator [Woeseiaceae bacterium]